jgi:trigger factor
MNIVKENKDALNAVLKLKIVKSDYNDRVETVLKDYRKKAKFDGFRPGMVPTGMVKKMYGKHVLMEELNKMVSEGLSQFITDEKLHLLGDPLPNFDDHSPLDLDNQEEFEFSFDIGLAPEFEVNLEKKVSYPYYRIIAEEKIIEDQVGRYASRYSTMIQAEESSEKAMLKGDVAQLDENGNILETGITKDAVVISPAVIRDEEEKKKFVTAKKGNTIDFDIRKAFPNDTEISSMLSISKDAAIELNGSFRITINEITEYIPHEINEDLFKSVYGEDVKTLEEFKVRIKEEIEKFYVKESDFKFLLDIKDGLSDSLNFDLPETFLKRWLVATNKELTEERVEKEYPLFTKDLKWQLIKEKIIRTNEIKVDEEEVLASAKEALLLQFQQYGLSSIPDEHLTNYAKETLKKDEERRKFFEKKYEDKVIDFLKGAVTLTDKEITPEDFNKLFATEEHEEHEHIHDENCNHDH